MAMAPRSRPAHPPVGCPCPGSVCPAPARFPLRCRTAGRCLWRRSPTASRCTPSAGWTVSTRWCCPGESRTGTPCRASTACRKPTAPRATTTAARSPPWSEPRRPAPAPPQTVPRAGAGLSLGTPHTTWGQDRVWPWAARTPPTRTRPWGREWVWNLFLGLWASGQGMPPAAEGAELLLIKDSEIVYTSLFAGLGSAS